MTKDTEVATIMPRPSIAVARQIAFGLAALSIGAALALYLFLLDMLLDRWAWWDKVYGDNATGLVGYL